MDKLDTPNIFRKLGVGLLGVGLLSYSLLPSEGMKYLWKRKSRRKWKEGRAEKRLYLTFDDGPSREYTGQLLDLLKQYGILATFFVVEEFARENPGMMA